MYFLRTLGELALYEADSWEEVRGSGDPLLSDAKSLAVLAYLALRPDEGARRRFLATLLWPDREPDRRRKSLRQALYYLRRKAGRDFLEGEDEVSLREDALRVDAAEFEDAVEREEDDRALALYGGEFLAGFEAGGREFRHWREATQERLRWEIRIVLRRSIERALRAGEEGRAVDRARRWVELNPLDAEARRRLVEVLIEVGRREEAYGKYEEYRTLLAEELEEEPDEQLRRQAERLHARLAKEPAAEEMALSSRSRGEDEEGGGGRESAPGGFGWAHLAGTAAAVGVLAAIGGWAFGQDGPRGPIDSVEAVLYVLEPGLNAQHRITLSGGDLKVRRTPYRRKTVPGPDGRRFVARTRAPDGLDLVLLSAEGDTLRWLTDARYDEVPWDFSPDGTKLLYGAAREVEEGAVWRRQLRVLDFGTGRSRSYTSLDSGNVGDARWSPTGARIAYVWEGDGARQIAVARADGKNRRFLTQSSGDNVTPSWSPRGRWVAFASERTGNWELFIARADGGEVRQVTYHPAADRDPVWLGRDQLGFVSERGGKERLWTLHLPSGDARPLLPDREVTSVLSVRRRPGKRWIDSVRIRFRRHVLGRRERVPLRVRAWDAAGRPLQPATLPIGWSSTRPEVLSLRGEGSPWGEAIERGRVALSATAGGWRADTLRVTVGRLVRSSVEPQFREDWAGSPLSERWVPFGAPKPVVSATSEARFDHVFHNRGDDHYASGAVSRRTFDVEDGLTVLAWGRAPFTQQLQQRWSLGLARTLPSEGEPVWATQALPVLLRVNGPDGQTTAKSSDVTVAGRTGRVASPGDWTPYALQVTPEGRVWVVLDGQLRRRTEQAVIDPGEEYHVVVAGRSENTRILHGPLAVYERPIYRIEANRSAGLSSGAADGGRWDWRCNRQGSATAAKCVRARSPDVHSSVRQPVWARRFCQAATRTGTGCVLTLLEPACFATTRERTGEIETHQMSAYCLISVTYL